MCRKLIYLISFILVLELAVDVVSTQEVLKINFQAQGFDIPEGYLPDFGEVFGDRGNGYSYGWDANMWWATRTRVESTDHRYNTLIEMKPPGHEDHTWEIAVPNGGYNVFLACGDPKYNDHISTHDVEGEIVEDPDGRDLFDEYYVTVYVNDGRLTIKPGPGALKCPIMFLHITRVKVFKASNPIPANGATHPDTKVDLSWWPGDDAVSHDVYFGDNFDDVNNATTSTPIIYKGRQDPNNYSVTSLIPGTTYYWRIDEVNESNIWPGDVWSFKIPSLTAYDPNPPNGATMVELDVTLNWTAGTGAGLHHVYLGTDKYAVENATTTSPECMDNKHVTTSYKPVPQKIIIEKGKTYYWRIDEYDGVNIYKGYVWSFSTIPIIPITHPNLLLRWKFDKDLDTATTAFDSSGYDHHGVINGTSLVLNGQVGEARNFYGITTGDYVVDEDAEDYINGLSAVTVCMWIKANEIGTNRGFINSEEPALRDDYGVAMRYDSFGYAGEGVNVFKMVVRTRQPDFTDHAQRLESSEYVQSTEWQHVAMTWRSGEMVRFYINAIENMPTFNDGPGQAGSTVTGCTKLIVGKGSEPGADGAWNGLIDDVRIYNWALSQEEIQIVMLGGGTDYPFAYGPDPPHGAVLVDPDTLLTWEPGFAAVSHDVYFGTNEQALVEATNGSPEFKGNHVANSYYPGLLKLDRTYYWRIDEVNDAHLDSPWQGDVWNFTTSPSIAHNPEPVNGARLVDLDVDISWCAGFTAVSHDVYFGTNEAAVAEATTSSPEFKGNQSDGIYDPGPLEMETIYYWRIDEVETDGTTKHKGDVWFFRTKVQNLIQNPGFESGNGSPSYWNLADDLDSPNYPLVNWTTNSRSGLRAISLSSPSGEWTAVEQSFSGMVVGKVYVFSFWFKTNGCGGAPEISFMGTNLSAYVRGSTSWTKYTYLITATDTRGTLILHNYHQTGCTFFFDDVWLHDDLQAIIYLYEPSKSPVTNSTPTFRWSCDLVKKYTSYDLVYSQDPNFQDATTVEVTGLLEANEYTPFEPLADGTWYWKLHLHATTLGNGATGETESEVASFNLISDGQDHRAPQIFSYGPTRMLDPNTPVVVEYADNPGGSGIDLARVTLKIDDRNVRARVTATEATYTERFSQDVHTGEITIYDKAGHRASKKWWFITKPKPQSGIVTFEPERKIFLIDDEPFFPFGMYQFRANAWDDPNPHIAYRSWGFNTTQFYDGDPFGGIKMAGEAEVRCFAMSVVGNAWNTYNPDVPWEDPTVARIIAQRIFEGCNLPYLFVWSIRDEPDGPELSRARLIMLKEFIHSLDPYHPTDVVLMSYGAYYAYKDVADLIVGDRYPYNMWEGGTLNGWKIWDEPIHQDAAQGENTPVITILQHFGGVPGTAWPYEIPNKDRRFMAYLAYIHGSRGLMWYAYGDASGFFAPDFPETWEYMKSLAAEFEAMSPILLSYDAPEDVVTSVTEPFGHCDPAGNPAIHSIMKAHGGKRYLIAANAATDKTVTVQFRIPDLEMISVKEIYVGGGSDQRPMQLTSPTTFSDLFEVFDTHIYEIEIAEPPIIADFDHNCKVDFRDAASFVMYWLSGNCELTNWCDGHDLDRSGEVNLPDFAIIAENWLEDNSS